MIGFLIFSLAIHCLSEEEPELPFEEVEKDNKAVNEENQIDEEEKKIKEAKVEVKPSVRIPLVSLLGIREVIVVVVLVVYIVVYFVGRHSISKMLAQATEKLSSTFSQYFAISPFRFLKNSISTYSSWITGRTGYQGALVTISFKKRCDIIGILIDLFSSASNTLTFEFVLNPPQEVPAIVYVSSSKPQFSEKLKLKSFPIGGGLSIHTDVGESKEIFISKITSFLDTHPGSIQLIEMSDANHYDTKAEGKYVARIEMRISGVEMINDELSKFLVDLVDAFVTLQLPSDISSNNLRHRAKLAAEEKKNEDKPEEEKKKLTPKEEEKLEKKLEKREARKISPRYKIAK